MAFPNSLGNERQEDVKGGAGGREGHRSVRACHDPLWCRSRETATQRGEQDCIPLQSEEELPCGAGAPPASDGRAKQVPESRFFTCVQHDIAEGFTYPPEVILTECEGSRSRERPRKTTTYLRCGRSPGFATTPVCQLSSLP